MNERSPGLMNIAVIFGGGVGRRMGNRDLPKQFMELRGKPVIAYTLEHFQKHPSIDAIVVVCLESWIERCHEIIRSFGYSKVRRIVAGGPTGQRSIYNGLLAAKDLVEDGDPVVMIHDAVRPLINGDVITRNIECVLRNGAAITTAPVKETIALVDGRRVNEITDRSATYLARAPQSFWLSDIIAGHEHAGNVGITDSLDSCSIMRRFGYEVTMVDGPHENIKITTPGDFVIFEAIERALREGRVLD